MTKLVQQTELRLAAIVALCKHAKTPKSRQPSLSFRLRDYRELTEYRLHKDSAMLSVSKISFIDHRMYFSADVRIALCIYTYVLLLALVGTV